MISTAKGPLLTWQIKHSPPNDCVNSRKGLSLPPMTVSSNAVTLRGTSAIVAAGVGGAGGGGGGGGGAAVADGGVCEVGVRSSAPDAPLILRACSSARSSRREVAASSLHMTQIMWVYVHK